MDFEEGPIRADIRRAVRQLCSSFPDAYWRDLDATKGYPLDFVRALTRDGWLASMIPTEYGGTGLGLSDACVILEEINRSGGNGAAAHAQMYTMGTILRHGSTAQKRAYLPLIANGDLRLQAFAVTEPDSGSDTSRIKTHAERSGDVYRISGQKVFISRAEHSDLMLLLARTTPYDELVDKRKGLSLFIVDLVGAVKRREVEIRPIDVMVNHHTTELFIHDLEVPVENLLGVEGDGFRHLIDGWNAERILVASEALGDGQWFTERASRYASGRVVFGRAIGANQGVQFPIAQAYASLAAASLLRDKAAWLFDAGQPCGPESNIAKFLASTASWSAANACLDTHGGYGFAREYDVERKFREARLLLTAPVSNNMVLAFLGHNVLGMPRSY